MNYLKKKALMEKHWKKKIRISKILETKIVIQNKYDMQQFFLKYVNYAQLILQNIIEHKKY